MSDLSVFLLARIAEDEAIQDRIAETRPHWMAECDAKRRIVQFHASRRDYASGRPVAFLALPYADHPDYREEWRP